jgi:hypothetical protein
MRRITITLLAVVLMGSALHAEETNMQADHPYVGLWVTEDGHIRHELLPSGRYVEARGTRERAYEGRYEVTGDHIEYWDDTGFTADGDFIDDVLHHAGMILYRR